MSTRHRLKVDQTPLGNNGEVGTATNADYLGVVSYWFRRHAILQPRSGAKVARNFDPSWALRGRIWAAPGAMGRPCTLRVGSILNFRAGDATSPTSSLARPVVARYLTALARDCGTLPGGQLVDCIQVPIQLTPRSVPRGNYLCGISTSEC